VKECQSDEGWQNFMKSSFEPWMLAAAKNDVRAKRLLEVKPLFSAVDKIDKSSFEMKVVLLTLQSCSSFRNSSQLHACRLGCLFDCNVSARGFSFPVCVVMCLAKLAEEIRGIFWPKAVWEATHGKELPKSEQIVMDKMVGALLPKVPGQALPIGCFKVYNNREHGVTRTDRVADSDSCFLGESQIAQNFAGT
jgi:hypothetical protein